jgi:hypothetical protein
MRASLGGFFTPSNICKQPDVRVALTASDWPSVAADDSRVCSECGLPEEGQGVVDNHEDSVRPITGDYDIKGRGIGLITSKPLVDRQQNKPFAASQNASSSIRRHWIYERQPYCTVGTRLRKIEGSIACLGCLPAFELSSRYEASRFKSAY